MRRALPAPFAALVFALVLGACNATAPAPEVAAPGARSAALGVTPESFTLPEGSGCAAEVARWKAIQDNDLATGHVTAAVHAKIGGEIGAAQTACAAGRDAEARGLVAASRKRHGYPAS